MALYDGDQAVLNAIGDLIPQDIWGEVSNNINTYGFSRYNDTLVTAIAKLVEFYKEYTYDFN